MSTITHQSINSSALSPTWCPGCGDFLILGAVQQALSQLQISEENLVIFYGIGCAGNMADFNRCYGFHSLHGRTLPNAMGAKMANQDLKILCIAGDGDAYGEGVNHIISAARGNHDITLLVHNNSRYSLTTGQVSPTSHKGTKAKSTPQGVIEQPVNPLLLALASDATFVARGYSSNLPLMIELIKAALTHPGFALIDMLQICPTFNKEMNHPWYVERNYLLDQTHDKTSKQQAMTKAMETDKYPLGILYQDSHSEPFHAQLTQTKEKSLLSQWSEQRDLGPSLHAFV